MCLHRFEERLIRFLCTEGVCVAESIRVLVTGATGYIGGLLVPQLLRNGCEVRVLARNPARLHGQAWLEQVEVAQGDVLDSSSLAHALDGIDVAYYLVHSMLEGGKFEGRDVDGAENFGRAAASAGVGRIIYLGGLGDPQSALSSHLRSRQATGEALQAGGVPVVEFRAAVVVGAGSASFEMIRYLTERVPVMICPSWVYTRVQPIAVRDVLAYLCAAAAGPVSMSQVIEIGGPDVLTYGDMLLGYARARGLRRWLLPVPVLTPRLSSLWVGLVTPLPAAIARPLVDGLRNEVVVRGDAARRLFPDIVPLAYEAAMEEALAPLESGRWASLTRQSLSEHGVSDHDVLRADVQGVFVERRQKLVHAPPAVVYAQFVRLGGRHGWLYANWIWLLRAWLDRLSGGPGARGRADLEGVKIDDVIDMWRVDRLVPGRQLRLRAEMNVPGVAWLDFEARPQPNNNTLLVQSNLFAPRGLWGTLSWLLLMPIHRVIFAGLLGALARRAESAAHAVGGRSSRAPTAPTPESVL